MNLGLLFKTQFIFYKKVINLFFLLFMQFSSSQENNHSIKSDTLKTKTFHELSVLSEKAFQNNDATLLGIYRNYHLKKAKIENNNLEIARAYHYFIAWDNFETDIKYSDSIIEITKHIDHEAYPTNGYILKANLYYYNSDFNKALDNFIQLMRGQKKSTTNP